MEDAKSVAGCSPSRRFRVGQTDVMRIQLFRQRLSYKGVKAYATMPIGIIGSKSLALLD